MSEELELKYAIDDPDTVVAWLDRRLPAADGAGWKTLDIADHYFDTPDLALSRAGYGARLRRVGPETTLTVKADIEVSRGLHRRLELEAPATTSLNPNEWPPSEARERLLAVVGDKRLMERFVVRQERRERELRLATGVVVASIDEGLVEVGGMACGELRQFEVELREGDPKVLDEIARRVEDSGLGVPESRSKLMMAAELAEAAGRIDLDDPFAEAGRKVLRRHLVRMLEREMAVRANDVLARKQMRVATRRMRATWRVFGDAFRQAEAQRHVEQLRRVAGALGEVRDLDVLVEGLPDEAGLAPLAAAWRERRAAAYERLREMLDSDQYRAFVDDYVAFTGEGGAGVAPRRGFAAVRDEVDGRIGNAITHLRAAGAAAAGSNDDAAWHALRIRAKRLRYTLEAFRDVLEPEPATAAIELLRTLQDRLGEMNDASVAAHEALAWLEDHEAAEAHVSQAVSVYIAGRLLAVRRERASFAAAWSAVARIEVPPIN